MLNTATLSIPEIDDEDAELELPGLQQAETQEPTEQSSEEAKDWDETSSSYCLWKVVAKDVVCVPPRVSLRAQPFFVRVCSLLFVVFVLFLCFCFVSLFVGLLVWLVHLCLLAPSVCFDSFVGILFCLVCCLNSLRMFCLCFCGLICVIVVFVAVVCLFACLFVLFCLSLFVCELALSVGMSGCVCLFVGSMFVCLFGWLVVGCLLNLCVCWPVGWFCVSFVLSFVFVCVLEVGQSVN